MASFLKCTTQLQNPAHQSPPKSNLLRHEVDRPTLFKIPMTHEWLRYCEHFPTNHINRYKTQPRRQTARQVIPTKWRSYRDHRLCDVTSP